MIGFDGWPVPPDPTPPADLSPASAWALLAIAIVTLAVIAFGEYCERYLLDEERRRQKARELQRACAEELAEHYRECLIDASPGGRKPWQERRK